MNNKTPTGYSTLSIHEAGHFIIGNYFGSGNEFIRVDILGNEDIVADLIVKFKQ